MFLSVEYLDVDGGCLEMSIVFVVCLVKFDCILLLVPSDFLENLLIAVFD